MSEVMFFRVQLKLNKLLYRRRRLIGAGGRVLDAMNLNDEAAKRKEIFFKKFPKCEAKGMVTL